MAYAARPLESEIQVGEGCYLGISVRATFTCRLMELALDQFDVANHPLLKLIQAKLSVDPGAHAFHDRG